MDYSKAKPADVRKLIREGKLSGQTSGMSKVSHDDIFVGSYGEFEGMKVRMLLDHDRQLRVQYGDYMQLPPEDQRHNHRAEIIDFGEY